ncbi:MAG: MFS transporter [Deltaproteobacteria bacterium]|nr:MAG: MFS transporter [Deltaproteobacteria bacterium]RLB84369.1 MAG: MFS transporter [Deltaproteobacteria bacterium]
MEQNLRSQPETSCVASEPGTSEYKGTLVLALSLTHFFHDIYSSFLAPLLPLLIKKLSLSLSQAGFLSTVMQAPALLNPYIGKIADRVSVRLFIVLAPGLTAVSMSLIGIAPSYGVLLILLFVAGISVSLFHVPAPVMVSRLSGAKIGKGMSYFMTGGELARTLGPLAAVGGVSLFGLEGFYPVMVVGLAASAWLFVKFKDVSITVENPQDISIRKTWSEMKFILLPLAGILVARGFMHASMSAFLPTFIKEETGNLWLGGTALTLFEFSGVVGVMSAGSFSDRFGRRKVLSASLFAAPVTLFLFAWLHSWLRFMALMLTGLSILSTTPVMLALVQEHAKGSPSAANGFFMMISFLARSAIVVVVGFLGDLVGLRNTYFISSFLGVLGIPLIFALPKDK